MRSEDRNEEKHDPDEGDEDPAEHFAVRFERAQLYALQTGDGIHTQDHVRRDRREGEQNGHHGNQTDPVAAGREERGYAFDHR